ncbi:putative NUDIX family NTP pyrophosphohydrolase [Nitrosomonas nitrosa]|uniref:NUDIX domain-containing protein n=1 Tax=Nitrosomonas nitrosa TaxID=52442 RepID=UPI000D2F5860|nr:NUDIX domain-containing protein [Nitrosomonas nitrosa]PTQ93906.1 putative NUDIX family NTP pyrophosphohydrolase [Nitrosomonas nitrosa]
MGIHSAGILLYRPIGGRLQVMLVHPGGPYWANKDDGAWSIPKGICQRDEAPLAAAKREFQEETGQKIEGTFIDLGEAKQPSGRTIHAWALAHHFDTSRIASNLFPLEWPPKSGTIQPRFLGWTGPECAVLGVQDKAQRRGIVTLFQGVTTQPCVHKIAQSAS